MAAPTISALPTPPSRTQDGPSTFSDKMDAFLDALPTFRSEANTLADFAESAGAAVSGIGIAAFFEIELADTTDSDPGAGKLKFGNATQQSATELYIDDDDIDGTTIRDQLNKISSIQNTVKGDLSLRKRDDKSTWLIFEVTAVTQNTGYTTLTVQNGDGSASTPFADEDTVVLGLTRGAGRGVNWRGTWDNSIAYTVRDLVGYNGNAYIANQDTNAGDEPGVSSKWDIFAQSGSVTSVNGETGDLRTYPALTGNGLKFLRVNSGETDTEWAVAGGLIPIASASASGDATIEFTGIDAAYDRYVVMLSNVIPADDLVSLYLRFSSDGGSTFDSGSSNYEWLVDFSTESNSSGVEDNTGDSQIDLSGSRPVGSDVNENGFSGEVNLVLPSNTSYTQIYFYGGFIDANPGGQMYAINGFGRRLAASSVDAIQLLFETGNIESGEFALYGVVK